jgi:dolichol-phosphate mannosyltransferase
MISIVFLGGIQLLGIGMIGEYIARINDNVKKRPLYLVDETNIKTHA